MDDYVVIRGKKLKKGYTTGVCAAGAAKAAAKMLLTGEKIEKIEIDTPTGVKLTLPLEEVEFKNNSVRCAIIKDGGDDPDVTTGLKIFAEVRFTSQLGVKVKAGEGIGMVTLPGLMVEVGKPAINPVPMAMILKEVSPFLPPDKGLEITISAPGGEDIAKKTFNPKLGIKGGISILGTTGIVEPMSEEAWKESLALELSILANKGKKEAGFVFGNYGLDFAKNVLKLPLSSLVKVSNFLGYMLDKAREYGFQKLLLAGHAGKLIKVAAGIFQTHSRVADGRGEILVAYAALEGADLALLERIYTCPTTEAAFELMREYNLERVFGRIAVNAAERCSQYTAKNVAVEAVLCDSHNNLLAMSRGAQKMIAEIRENYDS